MREVRCTYRGCALPAKIKAKLDGQIVGFYCLGHWQEFIPFFQWSPPKGEPIVTEEVFVAAQEETEAEAA